MELLVSWMKKKPDWGKITVFENRPKSRIQFASAASCVYILSGQKLIKNAKKWSILASFWKPEACYETQNAKIEKFKCDILTFEWFF